MAIQEMPIGTIIAWENTTIPENWAVCDGNNGTPNMVGRFVMGASVDGDVRATGGSETHTHTMPNTSTRLAHNHGGSKYMSAEPGSGDVWATAGGGANLACKPGHTHNGVSTSISSANAHAHSIGTTGSADHTPQNIRRVFIKRIS